MNQIFVITQWIHENHNLYPKPHKPGEEGGAAAPPGVQAGQFFGAEAKIWAESYLRRFFSRTCWKILNWICRNWKTAVNSEKLIFCKFRKWWHKFIPIRPIAFGHGCVPFWTEATAPKAKGGSYAYAGYQSTFAPKCFVIGCLRSS